MFVTVLLFREKQFILKAVGPVSVTQTVMLLGHLKPLHWDSPILIPHPNWDRRATPQELGPAQLWNSDETPRYLL